MAINPKYNQFIDTNKCGKNTKIHAIVDGLGNPVSFLLSGSQMHDSKMPIPLLKTTSIDGSNVIADHASGSEEIRTHIESQNATYVITSNKNILYLWDVDWFLYKERSLVECFSMD